MCLCSANNKQDCVLALHRIVYTGAHAVVPTPADVEKILGFLPSSDMGTDSLPPLPMSPSAAEFAARLNRRKQSGGLGAART